jgi:hypothetical protein
MVFALDPLVSVEITVLNDSGAPMEGVEVVGTFLGVSDFHTDVKTTDEFGVTVVRGRSLFPVGLITKKEGYYPTAAKVDTTEIVDNQVEYKDRKVIMTLRDKRNPIPLYAKHYRGYIPVAKEWLGFDLEKLDWVPPYGEGVTPDLQFKYDGYAKSFWDAEGRLDMRYSNEFDGLVDASGSVDSFSEMKVPHMAPVSGYQNNEIWWWLSMNGEHVKDHMPSALKYYFLRVRTILDAQGRVVSANYVKVYRDFNFFFSDKKGAIAGIKFDCYFNPTANDRNLEFNVDRNLFINLKNDEKVYEP